jgi:hypothetical protein
LEEDRPNTKQDLEAHPDIIKIDNDLSQLLTEVETHGDAGDVDKALVSC